MRLIDADTLIDEFEKYCKWECNLIDANDPDGLKCHSCPLFYCCEKIENELTIYPVTHHANGLWIQDKYTRRCSSCGNAFWMRSGNEWDYCPICGSKNKWGD